MSEPRVRALRPGDTEAVLALLRLGLGAGNVPRTPEFWRWKHDRNPFGRSYGLVAESGGRLVGVRVFLRWSFHAGERELVALRAVDTVTHPDWRGRGLFSRLTRELLAEVEPLTEVGTTGVGLVFNTPNRRSRPGYLKMGWRVAGRPPLMARCRNPLRHRGRHPGDGRRADLSTLPALAELLAPPKTGEPTPQNRADGWLSTVRSPAYLRWRYGEIPGVEYRILQRHRQGDGAALVFRERRRRGRTEIDVAEVLTGGSEGGIDLAADLLRGLVRQGRADWHLAVASPGSPERRALRRAGFLPVRWLAPRMTVLSLGHRTPDRVPSVDSWRWSLGDLEIF